MTERRPNGPGWIRIPIAGTPIGEDLARGYREAGGARFRIYAASAWQLGQVKVISAVEDGEYAGRPGVGPQDHISVSEHPRPASVEGVIIAQQAFGMEGVPVEWPAPGDVAAHMWKERP